MYTAKSSHSSAPNSYPTQFTKLVLGSPNKTKSLEQDKDEDMPCLFARVDIESDTDDEDYVEPPGKPSHPLISKHPSTSPTPFSITNSRYIPT